LLSSLGYSVFLVGITLFFVILLSVLTYMISTAFFVFRNILLFLWVPAAFAVISLAALTSDRLGYSLTDISFVEWGSIKISIQTIALAIFGIILISSVIAVLFIARLEALRKQHHSANPHVDMARAVFQALVLLQNAGERWSAPDVRAEAISLIGTAATLGRQYLFQKFVTLDEQTLAWRTRQGLRVSIKLAQKQTCLMTPKEDTRDKLFDCLGKVLIGLLSGTWDQLELASDEEVAAVAQIKDGEGVIRRVGRITLSVTRTLAVALLPAIFYIILEQAKLLTDVTPAALSYLKIGLFLWAALSFMLLLDPLLKEKLATVKEAVQLLKPAATNKH
jgi:hypothetical protein